VRDLLPELPGLCVVGPAQYYRPSFQEFLLPAVEHRRLQLTAQGFTECLEGGGIHVSMDGRGRALDNIFTKRLWRSLKYKDIYLRHYATVADLEAGRERYFASCNDERPHQSLNYVVPGRVHQGMVTLVCQDGTLTHSAPVVVQFVVQHMGVT